MDQCLGYIYTALWFIIAIYLFCQAFKESKFLFIVSAFFLYLGAWNLADTLITDINFFEGTYLNIFRIVAVVILVLCITAYVIHRKKPSKTNSDEKKE